MVSSVDDIVARSLSQRGSIADCICSCFRPVNQPPLHSERGRTSSLIRPPPLKCLSVSVCDTYLNLFRLGFGPLRHHDSQHAVPVFRLDAFRVYAIR